VRDVREPDGRVVVEDLVAEEGVLAEAHRHLAFGGGKSGLVDAGAEADQAGVAGARCGRVDEGADSGADAFGSDQNVGRGNPGEQGVRGSA
jgi:hypothetical protein